MYARLYFQWINIKGPLYNIGNSAHVTWHPGWEGSLGENRYVYAYG